MKSYAFGDVVLTSFPFASGGAGKQRPALVLVDTGDADIILAVIASKTQRSAQDVKLADWQQAGLLFPSTVRVHKVLTKEKTTIVGVLGKVTPSDLRIVRTSVQQLWNFPKL
jgi:mRNA interferase MazF